MLLHKCIFLEQNITFQSVATVFPRNDPKFVFSFFPEDKPSVTSFIKKRAAFTSFIQKLVFSYFLYQEILSTLTSFIQKLVFSYFLHQEIASTLTSFIQKLVYSYFLYPEMVSTLTTFTENSSEVSAQNLDKGSKCTSYFPYWEFNKELLENMLVTSQIAPKKFFRGHNI